MAKTCKTLRLTRVSLLAGDKSETEAFYRNLVGVAACERTERTVLFGSCILDVRQEHPPGMPIPAEAFTVFEASENLEECVTTLGCHGVLFHEPLPPEGGGCLAWFLGPYNHLHGLRESQSRPQTPIDPASSASQSPRIAYYFLAVDDLKVAIPFYRNVLGLAFIEAREGLYALFNAGGIILGLRQGKDAGAGVDSDSWTVFETSCCRQLYEEVEKYGATRLGIRSEPHGNVYWFRAPGGHVQCFHDPQPEYALDKILKRPRLATLPSWVKGDS